MKYFVNDDRIWEKGFSPKEAVECLEATLAGFSSDHEEDELYNLIGILFSDKHEPESPLASFAREYSLESFESDIGDLEDAFNGYPDSVEKLVARIENDYGVSIDFALDLCAEYRAGEYHSPVDLPFRGWLIATGRMEEGKRAVEELITLGAQAERRFLAGATWEEALAGSPDALQINNLLEEYIALCDREGIMEEDNSPARATIIPRAVRYAWRLE